MAGSTSWPWARLLIFACLHCWCCCFRTHFVSGQCLHHQRSLLLDLKTTLQFDSSISTKLARWDANKDCCLWSGVTCDSSTGQVVGLDLSSESISSGINSSSALFRLHSLRSLNMADNDLSGEMPSSAFAKLSHLTYLNLSEAGFFERVPIDTSYLENLEVLDLSVPGYFVCSGNLEEIITNLRNIRELYLDRISISAGSKPWGDILSSYLPHLQVLGMSGCNLTGEIPRSLASLPFLSVIHLDSNNFSAPVPEFMAVFRNLTTLTLSSCGLVGAVPLEIFQIPTLIAIDLSYNSMLQGTLPDFPLNSSLQTLQLELTDFSGTLPHSIGNLEMLHTLSLRDCNFHGTIPPSIASLSLLEYISLSSNNFSGMIPSFSAMKNLKKLYLQNNSLTGSISSTDWGDLLNLELVHLSSNSLTGSVPASLFSLASLQEIYLARNKFSGVLYEFVSMPSSNLSYLDLSRNDFVGEAPKSIFLLRGLLHLDISWNQFNGTVELDETLPQLQNLLYLDLSYNGVSVNAGGTTANIPFPQLNFLYLASCNLQFVPEFLKNQSYLVDLDLSNNHIQGRVPNWIWKVADGIQVSYARFRLLNLSCNAFFGLEQPIPKIAGLTILDLHSNNLQGQVPALPSKWGLSYVDFSNNSFTSVHSGIGEVVSEAVFFSLSRNNIHGSIPTSLCNATRLEVLELEYNSLRGAIPHCLVLMARTLAVLNLRQNSLSGFVPNEFGKDCMLETLDLNGNLLQGMIPRSLGNCKKLKVLDLGNNQLHGSFPCQLRSLSALQVLVLRSNKFHGRVACKESNALWPLLQIVDLASNNFKGELAPYLLRNWKSMMLETGSEASHLHYAENMVNVYYLDHVSVTYKGSELDLQKILSIFTSIDLSDNAFHGALPGELESLSGLKGLNLSHNNFSGDIPSSIGKLGQLESLDLSFNSLSGKIPQKLNYLNFLQVLNLSFNKLTGEIPAGTQLQRQEASAYIGNPGLCGPPLQLSCQSRDGSTFTPPDRSQMSIETELEWVFSGAQVGFPVGMAVVIGPLLYIKIWRKWVDKVAMKILFRATRK